MKHLAISLAAVFLAVSPCGCGDDERQAERVDYFCDLDAQGWQYELWVNGILVDEDQDGVGRSITAYLHEGVNTIKIVAEQTAEAAGPFAMVLDRRFEGRGTRILNESFEPAQLGCKTERQYEFQPDVVYDEEFWRGVEPITEITARDRQEILAIVKDIHRALVVRDRQKFHAILEPVAQETAAISGKSEERIEAMLEPLCEKLAESHLRPDGQIRIVPCGRLAVARGMDCDDRPGNYWIVRTPDLIPGDEGTQHYWLSHFEFARVDGRWRLVSLR